MALRDKQQETLWNIGKEYLTTIWSNNVVNFDNAICARNYEVAYWNLKCAVDNFSPFINEKKN